MSRLLPAPRAISAFISSGAPRRLLFSLALLLGTGLAAQAQGPPTITSFWPLLGPEGTRVVVNGRNLQTATSVRFNGINSPVISATGTQVVTTVPVGAGSGFIQVLSAVSTGIGVFDVFNVSPVITNFSPRVWLPGDVVTITGSYFQNAQAVELGVGWGTGSGLQGQNLSVNAAGTQITFTVPVSAASLPEDMRFRLKVTTPRGTGYSGLGLLQIRPTGLEDELGRTVLEVWPNPAHDAVRVELGPGNAKHPVQLLDATGRVVRSQPGMAAAGQLTFSLEGLQAGVYMVRRGASVHRLVIE